jgi:hypothetical protein
MAGLPTDWQETAMTAIAELRRDANFYGVGLPESWKTELAEFQRSGELRRLLNVLRVGFVKGEKIVALSKAETPKETKGKQHR